MQNPFRASQVIFIQLVESEEDRRYASRIIYVSEGHELWVGAPMAREEGAATETELLLEPDTPLILEVLLPDGIRRFPSVLRRRIAGTPSTLVVDWPKDIERIQRRNDVRVGVSLPVVLEPLARVENLARRIEATTSDLSAGGLRVVTTEPLPANLAVRVRLQMPDKQEIVAHGQVLRGQPIDEEGDRARYWAGIRFTAIDERDRREITQAVFDIQREMLRRGT